MLTCILTVLLYFFSAEFFFTISIAVFIKDVIKNNLWEAKQVKTHLVKGKFRKMFMSGVLPVNLCGGREF